MKEAMKRPAVVDGFLFLDMAAMVELVLVLEAGYLLVINSHSSTRNHMYTKQPRLFPFTRL